MNYFKNFLYVVNITTLSFVCKCCVFKKCVTPDEWKIVYVHLTLDFLTYSEFNGIRFWWTRLKTVYIIISTDTESLMSQKACVRQDIRQQLRCSEERIKERNSVAKRI